MKKILMSLLLIFICLSAGCKTVYTGPAMETQAIYSWGTLETIENSPIMIVNGAALKAMDTLGLNVTMKTVDSLAGQIVARDSQDQKISIKLNSLADNTTEVIIRVGAIGNEEKSRIIYKEIKKNLKK